MTEEGQEEPKWRPRFRWTSCEEPYATELEAIMGVWVDGGLPAADAVLELRDLQQRVCQAFGVICEQDEAGQLRHEQREQELNRYDRIFHDHAAAEEAIRLSQKREDVTAEQRLQSLRMIVGRNRPRLRER